MKNLTKHAITVLIILAVIISAVNCTKHNQVIGTSPPAVLNTDTLYSVKVTTAPAIQPINGPKWDGTIEAAWANAPKLTVHAVVPDFGDASGNATFNGWIGNSTDVTMRSMYDNNN